MMPTLAGSRCHSAACCVSNCACPCMAERLRLNPEHAFAQALRHARKRRGLSQEALGFESGYHRTYISMLERAQMNPSLRTILSIATALDIPAAQLVGDVENCSGVPGGGDQRRSIRLIAGCRLSPASLAFQSAGPADHAHDIPVAGFDQPAKKTAKAPPVAVPLAYSGPLFDPPDESLVVNGAEQYLHDVKGGAGRFFEQEPSVADLA